MTHYDKQTEEHGKLPRFNTPPILSEDLINHPPHYKNHPSGVECIEITKHMNFCLGNVVKYVWRADLKGNGIEDLQKAAKYIQFEIDRRQNNANVEE